MIVKVYRKVTSLRDREEKVKSFFISFYLIGLAGLVIPYTQPLFLKLTPLALILSFLAIMLFHRQKISKSTLMVFISIFVAGFLIELIGVNTGSIFGEYRYGKGLGPKLLNTPFLIGINWLLLVYLTSAVLSRFKIGTILSLLTASAIMLLYDVLLEQVAPALDMWYWQSNTVPLKNYIAWFIIALAFHLVLKLFKINTENKLASLILICHMAFFASLKIFDILIS